MNPPAKPINMLEAVERFADILLGTSIRGGVAWDKRHDMVDGKRKFMKHLTFRSHLAVLGCGAQGTFGLFVWQCKKLGVIACSQLP